MSDPTPAPMPDDAKPWDDEVYTPNGAEYRTLYPITPKEEEEAKDEND
jgi:hypothetical protein